VVGFAAKPPGNDSPPPGQVQFDANGIQPIDVQVAAGHDYMIVADAGHVKAYKKTGEQVPMLSVAQIFARFISPDDPANPRADDLNAHLFENERDPAKICVPCLIEDPVDHRKNHEADPTTSCICELYDLRVGYDAAHGRFWIAAAARNHIWHATFGKSPDGKVNPDTARSECISKLATRFILMAFSKDDNPGDGFPYANLVANDYNDWPLAAVSGHFAIFTHLNTATAIEIYDADLFAKDGSKQKLADYTPADYETTSMQLVRQHGKLDTVYFVGAKNRNELVLRGVSAAHPGKLLHGPSVRLKHNVPLVDAVLRNNRMHLVGQEGTGIRYFSFPIVTEPDGHIQIKDGARMVNVATEGPGVRTCLIQDPFAPRETIFDSPSVEASEDGDVIIAWRVSGSNHGAVVPIGMRYCVWYHDEPKPRQYAVLRAGDANSSAIKAPRIDFARGWIDETDGKSMWIAGVASAPDVKDNTGKVIRSPLKVVVGSVTP
jgi:hypothetical protein